MDGEVARPYQTCQEGERRAPYTWNSAVFGTDISGHHSFNWVYR